MGDYRLCLENFTGLHVVINHLIPSRSKAETETCQQKTLQRTTLNFCFIAGINAVVYTTKSVPTSKLKPFMIGIKLRCLVKRIALQKIFNHRMKSCSHGSLLAGLARLLHVLRISPNHDFLKDYFLFYFTGIPGVFWSCSLTSLGLNPSPLLPLAPPCSFLLPLTTLYSFLLPLARLCYFVAKCFLV